MQDTGSNSKGLWILGVVVLIIAVAGLAIAISAKNSAVDEDQVARDTTAQLKGELSGLGGALKAGKEAQTRANEEAARDRARIKRAVAAATRGAKRSINRLDSEVADLQAQSTSTRKSLSSLRTNVAGLDNGQQHLEAEVRVLKRRLNQFTASGPR
jgi:chromosome segregation ATPase